MKKILPFLWLILIFLFYFMIARDKSFFLRDDYNLALVAKDFSFDKIFLPHNQHFIPILRIFYYLQFKFFHMNFQNYLAVQIFYHLIIIWLVFRILKELVSNEIFAILGATAFSFLGSSFKIFILLASQTMAVAALFATLAILFFMKSLNEKSSKYQIFSIASAFLSSWCMAVGLAPFLAIFLLSLTVSRKNKKIIFLSMAALLISFFIYFLATRNLVIPEIKSHFNLSYLSTMVRFIFIGIIMGTIMEILFPFFVVLRGSAFIIAAKPIIALVSIITGLLFLKWLFQVKPRVRNHLAILFIFMLCHFGIISLGRASNLGYAFSPQYTYFPKAIFIIFIFFLLDRFWPKRNLALPLLLAFWITTNQGLHFYFEMKRWQPRIAFTKNYLEDLKYFFDKKETVLNLHFPESIAPSLKFSDMAKLIAPDRKINFIEKENTNTPSYLKNLADNSRAYSFYKKAIEGYDIKHY